MFFAEFSLYNIHCALQHIGRLTHKPVFFQILQSNNRDLWANRLRNKPLHNSQVLRHKKTLNVPPVLHHNQNLFPTLTGHTQSKRADRLNIKLLTVKCRFQVPQYPIYDLEVVHCFAPFCLRRIFRPLSLPAHTTDFC